MASSFLSGEISGSCPSLQDVDGCAVGPPSSAQGVARRVALEGLSLAGGKSKGIGSASFGGVHRAASVDDLLELEPVPLHKAERSQGHTRSSFRVRFLKKKAGRQRTGWGGSLERCGRKAESGPASSDRSSGKLGGGHLGGLWPGSRCGELDEDIGSRLSRVRAILDRFGPCPGADDAQEREGTLPDTGEREMHAGVHGAIAECLEKGKACRQLLADLSGDIERGEGGISRQSHQHFLQKVRELHVTDDAMSALLLRAQSASYWETARVIESVRGLVDTSLFTQCFTKMLERCPRTSERLNRLLSTSRHSPPTLCADVLVEDAQRREGGHPKKSSCGQVVGEERKCGVARVGGGVRTGGEVLPIPRPLPPIPFPEGGGVESISSGSAQAVSQVVAQSLLHVADQSARSEEEPVYSRPGEQSDDDEYVYCRSAQVEKSLYGGPEGALPVLLVALRDFATGVEQASEILRSCAVKLVRTLDNVRNTDSVFGPADPTRSPACTVSPSRRSSATDGHAPPEDRNVEPRDGVAHSETEDGSKIGAGLHAPDSGELSRL
ncbi:MAG: hypothetical protein OXF02_05760 [Simkaniaceae bacterium]|nr:hypothetical protein [Simkaniaceae bacterium]